MGRPTLLAAAFAALAAAPGCAGDGRRAVVTQRDQDPPMLLGGETEADVRQGWGVPDRVATFEDASLGRRTRAIWEFDRYIDTNGSRVVTTVTFEDGRVYSVRHHASAASADDPDWGSGRVPRDSAARRDME